MVTYARALGSATWGIETKTGSGLPQRSDADCFPLTKIFEDHAEQRKSLERPGVIEIKNKKRKS
ncbi:hypothetical protein COCC4DRAFT_32644 [Bipolaris maydis ATCC 48331]|uniref:Uncharacterized protein n=2 Tax=Cochliobolus heterostrophus TaxID=5016 RepID=M2UEX0_COCH5|nr:uncharacterized protein COCC4DRAFT_32644 [Bipolaris maydis ATCC 48331]EMD97079.1 hypothetical protein COCHEDRAFT_1018723 [Bipolaris maydis C5]ENI04455.1 hypothetical protein COCC4DRAFT_32644 [Bipolaris maydis ATCC 48331]